MLLAQSTDLPAVPADMLKWVLVILVGVFFIAVAIFGLVRMFAKPEPTRLNDDPPIKTEKAARRFNHDLAEARHSDHERRILALEKARDEFIVRLEEYHRELNAENEQRASRIHQHIEAERREMDKKIDGIFDRVIATLRNMGKL